MDISELDITRKQQYLKDMGYKIEVTGQHDPYTESVVKAFEDHFLYSK
jgi:N-acetyl-anhydromuramyl-L-alanine amidase AmpD